MPRFEIRQVVVLFESFSMLETCRTYIDAYHAGFRMADRILRCLPRSASGDEHIEIGAVLLFGPQQMMFGAVDILIPPHIASTVQIFQGWRKRVTRVEVADGMSVRFSRFRLHECFTCSENWGARIIHCHQSKTSPNRASIPRRPAFVTRIALLSRSFVTHLLLTAASNSAEPKAPPM